MARWSSKAMTDMSEAITNVGESADAVATLRNLINQWADGLGGNHGARTFTNQDFQGTGIVLRHNFLATADNGEVLGVDVG